MKKHVKHGMSILLCILMIASCFSFALAADWSDWTTDTSKLNDSRYEHESKNQYSTRTKQTTTSTSPSLSGWTRDDSKTTYKISWSGSVSYYDNQQSTSETFRYVGTRTVGGGTQTYLYRYYNPNTNDFLTWQKAGYIEDGYWVYNYYSYDIYQSGQALYMSDEIKNHGSDYPCWKGGTRQVGGKTQYGYESGTKVYTYTFYRWSDWSAWKDGTKTANDSTRTRTVYRYRLKNNIYNLGDETYSFKNYGDNDSPGGHCFGMSSTSSLYYLQSIDIARVGGTWCNLYALSDNKTVRSPICHYQNIQGRIAAQSMVAGGRSYLQKPLDIGADWKEVLNYVKNHTYDNKGTLQIGYRQNGSGGHAINFLRYEVVNGQDRIYAYDNNFPTTETYFYLSNGQVLQAPESTFKGAIDSICLRDMKKYFSYVGDFDLTHAIYADKDAITIDNITAYPIDGGIDLRERVIYEIPQSESKVKIIPNADNATFYYCDEEYRFGSINDDTYAELTLKSLDDNTESDTANFHIFNAPDSCPWCGKVHKGFFQSIIFVFHRLFARIFGAKY